jgi:hypothetical protein
MTTVAQRIAHRAEELAADCPRAPLGESHARSKPAHLRPP